jgi:osmotically-inducible protein OsmY
MKASRLTKRIQALRMAAMLTVVATLLATGCAARQEVALRDDSAITKDVQDRLGANPVSSKAQIGVETKSGIVSLSGNVSEDVRSSAEQVARDTPGVRSVDNNMRFGMTAPAAN